MLTTVLSLSLQILTTVLSLSIQILTTVLSLSIQILTTVLSPSSALGSWILTTADNVLFEELYDASLEAYDGSWTAHSIQMLSAYFSKRAAQLPPGTIVLPRGAFFPFSWHVGE
jgi:hypothetical protein